MLFFLSNKNKPPENREANRRELHYDCCIQIHCVGHHVEVTIRLWKQTYYDNLCMCAWVFFFHCMHCIFIVHFLCKFIAYITCHCRWESPINPSTVLVLPYELKIGQRGSFYIFVWSAVLELMRKPTNKVGIMIVLMAWINSLTFILTANNVTDNCLNQLENTLNWHTINMWSI